MSKAFTKEPDGESDEHEHAAEVVNPEAPRSGRAATHVFFGATVRCPRTGDWQA